MRLIHYSDIRLAELWSVPQAEEPNDKPKGLWVSVGEDWKEWCEGAGFRLDHLAAETEIRLRSNEVLTLSAPCDIYYLSQEFGWVPDFPHSPDLRYRYYFIDWSPVAEKWDGIIIAPYQWECRRHEKSRWYYCWDCASSCIWNANAMEIVK